MNKFKIMNTSLNIIYLIIFITVFFQFIDNLSKNFPVEFFINYEDGLIRRGLIGSLLYNISELFNLKSINYIIWFVWSLIFLNIIIAVSIFQKYKIEYFFLLTSPMFLNILSKNIPFRLDLILIPLIFLQLILLKKDHISITIKVVLSSLIMCIGILIHEIYYIVFLCVSFFILFYKLNIKYIYYYILFYLFPTILFIIITTTFKGNEEQVNNIILSWSSLNIEESKLDYLKWLFSLKEPLYIWNNKDLMNNHFMIVGFFLNYFILCTLSYLFFNILFKIKNKSKILLVVNFSIILLLSIIAEDYIRWFVYMTLINLYYLVIFEERKNIQEINYKYISLKFLFLFIGVPMVKIWSLKLFFWTSPIRNLIFFYYLI